MSFFCALNISRSNKDLAIILNIDIGSGFFDDLLDVFSARTDHQTDLGRIDLYARDSRSIRRQFFARLAQHGFDLVQDNIPGILGLFEDLLDKIVGQAIDFYVNLDAGNAFSGARNLKVHITQEILDALDIGNQFLLATFFYQTNGYACHGIIDLDPGIHQSQSAAAGCCHGSGAIGA